VTVPVALVPPATNAGLRETLARTGFEDGVDVGVAVGVGVAVVDAVGVGVGVGV
jgi:hypothetical protein